MKIESILLTGHTGYLGKVVLKELKRSFNVLTLGRDSNSDYVVDFEYWDGLLDLKHKIDAIVHVAGLAHKKEEREDLIWSVNVRSVEKLLIISKNHTIRTFVFISSVAVYGRTIGLNIDESYQTKPNTVYGKSKLYSEDLICEWGKSVVDRRFINLRLPLVIASNAPGNLGMLSRSIANGYHIFLDGNNAKKSVVFAIDVAKFISEWLNNNCRLSDTVNLCNQTQPTFNWIEKAIAVSGAYRFFLVISFKPVWELIVWLRIKVGLNVPVLGTVAYSLTFSDRLAREKFGYCSKELTYRSFKDETSN